MKNRPLILSAIMGTMALSFACGGGAATNNANTADNKAAANSGTAVKGPANITVTPAGNTATNTPANVAFNAANKPANAKANAKDTAAANKPLTPPKGANYICRDNTYSMGNQDSTACSGHGGVQRPLNEKPQ